MLGGAFPSAFSEGSRRGGTTSGMAIGGLSSALTGAGTGAAIGSFIGPIGTGLGAGIGAGVGGLIGVFDKLETSFEELAETINRTNEKIRKESEAADNARRAFKEISELKAEGASPRDIDKATRTFRSAMLKLFLINVY